MKLGGECVLNVKALVGDFNQEKALVEAFSVIVKLKLREGPIPALLAVFFKVEDAAEYCRA